MRYWQIAFAGLAGHTTLHFLTNNVVAQVYALVTHEHGRPCNKFAYFMLTLAAKRTVQQNEEFVAMARDIAMHVTATSPEYVDETEITPEVRAKVTDMFKKEVEESGKPADIQAKMMEGKLATYFGERTLLNQAFVKNPDITIKQLVDGGVQKFGEKIAVARFSRFAVAK